MLSIFRVWIYVFAQIPHLCVCIELATTWTNLLTGYFDYLIGLFSNWVVILYVDFGHFYFFVRWTFSVPGNTVFFSPSVLLFLSREMPFDWWLRYTHEFSPFQRIKKKNTQQNATFFCFLAFSEQRLFFFSCRLTSRQCFFSHSLRFFFSLATLLLVVSFILFSAIHL